MKASLFRIGLALVIVGIVWISLVFAEAEKTHVISTIKQAGSVEVKMEFSGTGIGFYRVHMPEFAGNEVFVQIRDPGNNVIQEQRVQTRMSVGYFEFGQDGRYSAILTNVSEDPVAVDAEIGETDSQEMMPAGILVLAGSVAMMVMAYLRISSYSTAQPDENIS